MRQGITTRYLGPTNTKGSRIKAVARKADNWGKEMSLTDHMNNALNPDANHTRVAQLLATELEWKGVWIGAGKPEDDGYQYAALEGSFSREWAERYLCGKEGVDWFLVP